MLENSSKPWLYTAMLCLLLYQCFLLVNVNADKCTCNVRFVGEYCGLILNQRNTANNCSADMYFCGKSNMGDEGVILKRCTQRGFECDKKLNGGNACYQNVKCLCGQNLGRKSKYCGTELNGPDCQPNVIYRCPMFRRYNPSPEDACPYGCKNGKCLEKSEK